MSGLGLTFLRRGNLAHPTAGSDYIKFADEGVLNLLMSKGVSSDGVGITKDDAAKVTSLSSWFKGNTTIKSFDEFQYFTNVTALAASAFQGCSALASIAFPKSLKTIGSSCFQNCTALTFDELYLDATSIGSNAFFGCIIKKLHLTSASSLPNSTQNTETWGAKTSLEEIYFPSSLISIPQYTLFTYKVLKKVVIPEGVQSLGLYAVRGCSALLSFDLPSTINSIASGVFAYSDNIQYGIIRAVTPPTLTNVDAFVQNAGKTYPIYVPDASVDAYKSANVWSGIASRIKPLSEYQG
jgi:hypothetical protein